MVVAYRVYYTTFYDEEHEKVKKLLKELLGVEPVDHRSRVPGFRYLEFRSDGLQSGLSGEIEKAVKSVVGEDAYVRVDYIRV